MFVQTLHLFLLVTKLSIVVVVVILHICNLPSGWHVAGHIDLSYVTNSYPCWLGYNLYHVDYHYYTDTSYRVTMGFAKKTNSKIRVYYGSGWVSRSHSEFFGENHPKIALKQWYFGVVYHVYTVCLYIVKSCWLLWFECSFHVNDGFPKQSLHGGWVGEVSSIQVYFGFLESTIILLKSVCRCSQSAGRNSCSIILGDVSKCSYRLTVYPVTSLRLNSA